MKNPLIYVLIAFALLATSCAKDDPKSDVEALITNLEYFNNTFDKHYEDGEISMEAEGEADSEYDELRAIANSYYESVNKINKRIKKEQQELEEGKEIDNYEEKYHEAIKEKEDELEKATEEFMENLEKIEEDK
ncbi:MAG: hypothetical protein ACLFM1_01880 [Bacteroidales bacterium]